MQIDENTTLLYHKILNPKIWSIDGELLPEISLHLKKIAKDWMEFAKIPETAVNEIILTGSNCNYNYTEQSDIDVHFIVKYSEVNSDSDMLKDYYMSKKNLWAVRHPDAKIYDYPVELFAQDVSEKPHKGQGVYSLMNNVWVQPPEYLALDLEHDQGVEFSSKEFETRIKSVISNDRGVDVAKAISDEVYNMRGSGIAKEGEFSKGTLIFKDLRNKGILDKLNKYIVENQDKEYSLKD